MNQNPLQKYFRQPKIYIGLPSKGIYSDPAAIEGASEQLPIMSMTGMDELLLKTPDALMNGEATVRVIQSCCPNIKNAWEVSGLDLDVLLVAIRIATYGNDMSVEHQCPNCSNVNDYNVDLMAIVDHFSRCAYDSRIVKKDLTIFTRPLNYKAMTEFNLKTFELRRQLEQIVRSGGEETNSKLIGELYAKLADIQNETYIASVDSVQVPDGVVDERAWITEWVINTEKSIFDAIKEQIEKNNDIWRIPQMHVTCASCQHETDVGIQMDQSNFFVGA